VIAMTLAQIAEVVVGEVHGDPSVVVTAPAFVDSRAVEPGGLFVAVVGDHVDGHEYAAGAVAAGAAAVLGSRVTDAPTVVVADPVAALGKLARNVVDQLDGLTVLALTGSQGKTGTKDYLAQVLATAGETVATAGNFNNEIGVPLTVLRATSETDYLVVEMGARGIGHIRYLCQIANPRIAAVINVGTAHMSEFGSREAIAQAKGEILEGLPEDGTAVLNEDDELVRAMRPRTRAGVLSFGASAEADVRIDEVELDALGRPTATFTAHGTSARISLQQIGVHQLQNAAAAMAMALAAGLEPERVTEALGAAVGRSRWRMELHERPDGVTVVNDAYNANPASMRAAIDALEGIGRAGRRTVAVLGEMRELGDGSAQAHTEIGEYAAAHGVGVLLVIGEPARPMLEGAANITSWPGTATFVEDRAAALAWLRENVVADDVVLVKASRGAALEWVAEGLLEEGER
jgi:UDP-N-acetylmuramoyl-tripeptide--D-alanyl-D-alanine ligase